MLIKTERYLKKKDTLILTNQSCASKMMLIILQLITIFQALFRRNNSFYYVSLILRIINRFKMSVVQLCNCTNKKCKRFIRHNSCFILCTIIEKWIHRTIKIMENQKTIITNISSVYYVHDDKDANLNKLASKLDRSSNDNKKILNMLVRGVWRPLIRVVVVIVVVASET